MSLTTALVARQGGRWGVLSIICYVALNLLSQFYIQHFYEEMPFDGGFLFNLTEKMARGGGGGPVNSVVSIWQQRFDREISL